MIDLFNWIGEDPEKAMIVFTTIVAMLLYVIKAIANINKVMSDVIEEREPPGTKTFKKPIKSAIQAAELVSKDPLTRLFFKRMAKKAKQRFDVKK